MIRKWELIGRRFGQLIVIAEVPAKKRIRRWQCQCDCGTSVIYYQSNLLQGKAFSCGCTNLVKLRHEAKKAYRAEWLVWRAMRDRCRYPTDPRYDDYGGRGIKVCERWREFRNFIADMGPRPSPKHQIDRYPDKNGDYEPGNCRWATSREQNNNKRTNRLLTFNGETRTAQEWGRKIGIRGSTIRYRLDRGMTIEQALQK